MYQLWENIVLATTMNRHVKIPDFAVMLERLVSDDMTLSAIAKHCYTHSATLSQIKNETRDLPPGWESSYLLLDLYIRKYGMPVPFYGEHNE